MKKNIPLLALLICLFYQSFAQQNIIGGNQISIEDAPYQVSLVDWTSIPQDPNPGPKFRCGGWLISDQWIVTAAHCIDTKYDPSGTGMYPWTFPHNLNIYIGYQKRGHFYVSGTSVPITIQEADTVIVHPNFLDAFGATSSKFDIALVKLETPIPFDHTKYPVEFANTCNTDTSDYIIGTDAFLTGWGDTSSTATPTPVEFLRGTHSKLITNDSANQIHTNNFFPGNQVDSNMLAFLNDTSTSYNWDSGGPAVIDKNGNKISIGVTSWSFKHQNINPVDLPTIYTNVKAFENFITSNTGISLPSSTLDLYTKDKPWDMGEEPFQNPEAWTSEDIWVRQKKDGIEENQPAAHYANSILTPNYVYVRVTNNSCMPSTGNEVLKVYCAKAATALAWPTHWDGSLSIGNQSLGDIIDSITLPIIEPGDAYVHAFSWYPPSPAAFDSLYDSTSQIFNSNQPHHFCLLSRIESTTDTMTTSETSNVCYNTINNNNIAWRNVSVIDLDSADLVSGGSGDDVPVGATVFVGGIGENENYDLEFCNSPRAGEFIVTEYAEVKVTFDTELWTLWENVDFEGEGFEIINPEKHQFILTDTCAVVKNIELEGYDQYLVHTSFNFLIEEFEEENQFHFSAVQKKSEDQSIIGGESFEIKVPNRWYFEADGGSGYEVLLGESVTLVASQITEEAIYNWYNQEGDLIYTGVELTITPEYSQSYTLEVIATVDGFKDYDEIEVTVKENYIISCSPNPAASYINVNYKTNEVSQAHFLLVNQQNTISFQFPIDPLQENTQLSLSNVNTGNYALVLITDDVIQDYKNIIIQ